MSPNNFRIPRFDHVELYVPDQYEAAGWYERIFGLEIIPEFEFWAEEGGPLMIAAADGVTKLALFRGQPPGFAKPVGFQRVAFGVSGDEFLQFLQHIAERPVYGHDGQPVTHLDVIDHDRSYSVYFCDPYGNRYEVTTYDYDFVTQRLAQA